MQTAISADRAKAVPGLLADNRLDNYVTGRYVAGEDIYPGRLVVLNASTGKLQHPQDTSFAKAVGIACYSPTNQQTAIPATGFVYAAGAQVPVLRRGRVWAEVSSSSEPGQLVESNVKHSSTVATHRGKMTTDVVSTGAGTEVADGGAIAFVEKATTTLWLVEINYPGNQTDDDARLDILETDAGTANACMHIPLTSFLDADGDPLAKFASAGTPTFGFNLADSEALNIRWNNDATPGTALCQFSLPADLDDAQDAYLEFLCSKSGATVGDATTLTITAFITKDGDLHDADADCGGVTGALTGNATAKTLKALSRTIGNADIPAAARSMTFTVTPTAGLLGTDDLMLHSVRFRYHRKLQTS